MLMRELRRDRAPPEPSAPSAEFDDTQSAHRNPAESPQPADQPTDNSYIDDSLSWSDRFKFYCMRAISWYEEQSEDTKTFMKVALVILALYVAFGGRFGLESVFDKGDRHRGNYEPGNNAYDRYHRRTSHGTSYSSYPYDRGSYGTTRQSSYYDDDYDYEPRTTSYHFPNLFDGSIPSMVILVAIGYFCHRNGINPFHALWMLNMATGRRGRGMHMHRMGMYGMGYGMARNAFRQRGRPQPGRW
jgi:hypothetical protein